jgi:hypothetical protein
MSPAATMLAGGAAAATVVVVGIVVGGAVVVVVEELDVDVTGAGVVGVLESAHDAVDNRAAAARAAAHALTLAMGFGMTPS